MKLLIITDEKEFFYQHEDISKSINVFDIKRLLNNFGFDVFIKKYTEVRNNIRKYEGYIIFYTSSYDPIYRKFSQEVAYHLSKKNLLLPKYEHFLCHENKDFQELYKIDCELDSLASSSYCNIDFIDEIENKHSYPFIIKEIDGAGSSSVYKVSSKKELECTYNKIHSTNGSALIKIKNWVKKLISLFNNSKFIETVDFKKSIYKRFIVQDMLEGLKYDWKILIFGSKIFALKRGVPDNDFRASGQGLLFYDEKPNDTVLEYALNVFKKLDTPHVALDLAQDDNGNVYLIEFQANAFGPITMLKSSYFYSVSKDKKSFNTFENKYNLEDVFASSLIEYLDSQAKKPK
jgi:hypothetical protein